MKRRTAVIAVLLLVGVAWAGSAWAETITFKLLKNQSRATFKSDAPLETFVGNTAAEGLDATLTVDPAQPQAAMGMVKVDMHLVRTASTSATATCAARTT